MFLDGLDGWNKMQNADRGQQEYSGKHYNNHHFNHHYNHNNHISSSSNHHYRQRRHGGNNLHHSSNGFDVYHEWTPSQQTHDSKERNKRKGKIRKHGKLFNYIC